MTDAIVAEVANLPVNKLRLSHGSNIVGRQLYEFLPQEGGGKLSVNDTQQINIAIGTASPAVYLNPRESMLKVRCEITGGTADPASVNNKYIFKGVSTLLKSIQVSHMTKSTVFEDLQNADLFIQASKSLLPDSYWDSLAWDVDGSIVNKTQVYEKSNVSANSALTAYRGEGLICDGSKTYADADTGARRFYNADEVNSVITRTKNKVFEVEVPLPSGLLSSSNDTLLPIGQCPLKLTLNLNNIATAFKASNSGALPADVKLTVRYFGSLYTVSDENVAKTNALISSSGLAIDFERVSNYSVQLNAGSSSFTYTFPVQNISDLKSVMAFMVPKSAVNSGLKDRYWFGDGSAEDAGSTKWVNSVQYSVGNQYFPNAPLQVGPYQYGTLHILSKSAMLGEGEGIVYQTDSNHVQNYAGELDGAYVPKLADKFMMNMSFVKLKAGAKRSGLPLINSPLTIYLNFNDSGPAEDMVLHIFLVHGAELRLTPSDVEVRF